MAKYQQRNNVGSLVLDRHSNENHHHHHRIWSAFSGVAFRRKILDTMRCGVSRHRYEVDSDDELPEPQKEENDEEEEPVPVIVTSKRNVGSETLSEILNSSVSSETVEEEEEEETEDEAKRKIKVFEELQGVVKKLQFDDGSKEMVEAALDVRRLAKDDSEARTMLAMLGAIPPLVGMIDSSSNSEVQIASLYALLNLGIGNDMNKSAIVKAGAVHKMLNLVAVGDSVPNRLVSEAVVANFLGLSALDSNKPVIGSSGAIPFLVKTIQNVEEKCSVQAKHDSLRAIYNLSISLVNMSHILETNLVSFLLYTLGDMEFSERILSILSNVVSTPEGRKAISSTPDAFPILIDVLNWTDSPGCQEKVSYILMVMAHKAYGDRQAMIEAGMVSALLELTLLGSTLAQKRASRILECLRVDKRKQQVSLDGCYNGGVGAVSAPICGGGSSSFSAGGPNLDPKQVLEEQEEEEDMMSAEKKAVKQLVQQSLQNNMRRIVKRANLPQDFVPSDHFKSLTTTSTSKSLPF